MEANQLQMTQGEFEQILGQKEVNLNIYLREINRLEQENQQLRHENEQLQEEN